MSANQSNRNVSQGELSHRLEGLESPRLEYCPTEAEILRASAQIREGWSPLERRRRRVGPDGEEDGLKPWYPPVIDTSTLVAGVKLDGP